MSVLNKLGRKLFVPNCHLWIRPTALAECQTTSNTRSTAAAELTKVSASSSPLAIVDVGLTFRGMEDIGDVSGITSSMEVQNSSIRSKHQEGSNSNVDMNMKTFISAGEAVMKIEWDGHAHSEADELYHAVWETFTEVTNISSPVSGILRSTCMDDNSSSIHIDDETTLFTIETDYDTLNTEIGSVGVTENVYRQFVQRQPRGIFFDETN